MLKRRVIPICFLDVLFSGWVCHNLLIQCGAPRSPVGFDQELDWFIQRCSQATAYNSLLKLSFAAIIYHVWGERNARIFKAKSGDGAVVLGNVQRDIRACLSAWENVKCTAGMAMD